MQVDAAALHWSVDRRRCRIGARLAAVLTLGLSLVFVAGCGSDGASLLPDQPLGESVTDVVERGNPMRDPFVGSAELLGFEVDLARRPMADLQRLRKTAGKSGCNAALPAGFSPGKTALQTIVSGGMKRTYRVHVPANVSTTQPMALVLNFHGRSGTGIDQEITSGLVPISDREGFVLVSPDGTGTPMGWSAGATEPNAIDDVRFTEDILNAVMSQLCVDAARVYATGFSNGAFMASRLACQIPDRIAAVAAVGGVDFPGERCESTVPLLAVHGTADSIVPIEGGIVRQWRYDGAYDAIDDWAANNGCRSARTGQEVAEGVSHEAYLDCAAATEFVTIKDCEHLWPGYPGVQADNPAARLSGGELVWSFLSQKRIASS